MKKLFIVFAILCLAAPAMAADWDFYGQARFGTFWSDEDDNDPDTQDLTQLYWTTQGNARIGANVTVNDNLGGKFEYGTGVNVRQLYGTYTFGNGLKLLVGRGWTPLSTLYNNQVVFGDNGLAGFGDLSYREDMLRFSIGGFKLALIDTGTHETDGLGNLGTGTVAGTFEKQIPKIEAKYTFAMENLQFDIAGGYNTSDFYVTTGTGDPSYGVDAYIVQVGSAGSFGAFSYAVQVYTGRNVDDYMGDLWGTQEGLFTSRAHFDAANNQVIDSDSLGGFIQLGMTFSEMLAAEIGYGYVKSEVDPAPGVTAKTETVSYYFQLPITIAPGVVVVPEIGVIGDTELDVTGSPSEDLGKETYFGAKWQINF